MSGGEELGCSSEEELDMMLVLVLVEVMEMGDDDALMGWKQQQDISKIEYTRYVSQGNYMEIIKELFSQ